MRIQIDGKEIQVQPGDTILQAARRAGIFIPSLCYSDPTEPTHSCRLCMVEVKEGGGYRTVASCAFKVKNDMKIVTDTERLVKMRKTLLQLLYAQAPENPTIQYLLDYYGVERESAYSNKDGQCILCGLCVQTCKKLGASAISTVSRGISKKVSTPYDTQAKNCIGCASCAGFCPTNCIDVVDTEEGRTIWKKTFKWARCEICGAIVGTEQHYQAATGSKQVICPDCRKRTITDVFANTLGESE